MTITSSNIYHNEDAHKLITNWRTRAKRLVKVSRNKRTGFLDKITVDVQVTTLRQCANQLKYLVNKL